jgi:ribosomal protein L44E
MPSSIMRYCPFCAKLTHHRLIRDHAGFLEWCQGCFRVRLAGKTLAFPTSNRARRARNW